MTGLGTDERMVHLGVIIAGLSVTAFSVSAFLAGSVILVIGVAVAATGARGLLARESSSLTNETVKFDYTFVLLKLLLEDVELQTLTRVWCDRWHKSNQPSR